jgi:hypothetical protein
LLTSGLVVESPAWGQQIRGGQTELQQLRSELKGIEARIDALEAAQAATQKPASAAAGSAVASASAPTAKVEIAQLQQGAATGAEAVKRPKTEAWTRWTRGWAGIRLAFHTCRK